MSINLEMSRTMKFLFVSLHITDVLELKWLSCQKSKTGQHVKFA